uniref:Uncharacterized protein n=1 Tax=Arundo donax TaxID=35708 RepID=A0A0A9A5D0_ARUDO
MREYMQNF